MKLIQEINRPVRRWKARAAGSVLLALLLSWASVAPSRASTQTFPVTQIQIPSTTLPLFPGLSGVIAESNNSVTQLEITSDNELVLESGAQSAALGIVSTGAAPAGSLDGTALLRNDGSVRTGTIRLVASGDWVQLGTSVAQPCNGSGAAGEQDQMSFTMEKTDSYQVQLAGSGGSITFQAASYRGDGSGKTSCQLH